MPGGEIQLVAVGAQDIMLTGSPEITHFTTLFRSYVNFAIETMSVFPCQTNINFGNTFDIRVSKCGDLVANVTLEIDLPEISIMTPGVKFAWVDNIGNVILKQVDIIIGRSRIDSQYGTFYNVWNELTMSSEKERGYNDMIGQQNLQEYVQESGFVQQYYNGLQVFKRKHPRTKLKVPLNFWFCRNNGLALPLIALQCNDIRFSIKLRSFDELHKIIGKRCNEFYERPFENIMAYIDYIFLDDRERRNFRENPREYLITQHERITEIIDKPHCEINLYRFSNPVKELIWTVQEERTLQPNNNRLAIYSDEKIEKTIIEDEIVNILMQYGFPPEVGTYILNFYIDQVRKSHAINNWSNYGHKYLMESAKLIVQGVERFQTMDAKYFNLEQPYTYHTRVPKGKNIYVYSFCLKPEEHQPSGTMNFSLLENAKLVLRLPMASEENPMYVEVHAINYNCFRVGNGQGTVMYR